MEAALATFAFLRGMVAGSFVSVVAYRVPRGESIVGPARSAPAADRRSRPTTTFRSSRGCCSGATAATATPRSRPATRWSSSASALLFAAAAVVLKGDPADITMGFALLATLAAITLTDLERRVIPNAILAVSAVIGVALAATMDPSSLPERAIAAARRRRLPALGRGRLSEGDGHGRRQARRGDRASISAAPWRPRCS